MREREAETQAEGEAGSMHREPDMGFDPGSPGSRLGQRQAPNRCTTQGSQSLFLNKDFICLFMRDREREAETQTEREAGSMQEA